MLIKTTLSDNLLPVVRALCLVKNNKTIEAVLAIKRSYNVRYRKNIVAKDEYVDVPITDILEWYCEDDIDVYNINIGYYKVDPNSKVFNDIRFLV